jgi:hypothetical protein
MNRLFVAVFVILISNLVLSKTVKSKETPYRSALKKCSKASYEPKCHEVFEQLFSENKYDDAYKVALAGCSVSVKLCEKANTVVQFTKSKKNSALINILSKKCETNSNYCDFLVLVYKEKKQFKLALTTAKKNFKRTGSLQYALLLQELKKDQKLIEKVSFQSCTRNTKNCDRVLRYFATPANQEKVANRVKKECERQASGKSGADYCSIVGTYYFKRGEVQKALKMWSQSCSYNELTCLLILGSNKADRIIEIDAFNAFCKEGPLTESTAAELRREHCLIGVREVPSQIKDHGRKLLQSFTMQQR